MSVGRDDDADTAINAMVGEVVVVVVVLARQLCATILWAARCKPVCRSLEQNIRSKLRKHKTTQNQKPILNTHAHRFFAFTSALPAIRSLQTAG
jgi:hypothetical protein